MAAEMACLDKSYDAKVKMEGVLSWQRRGGQMDIPQLAAKMNV